jgi:hypothetical protein
MYFPDEQKALEMQVILRQPPQPETQPHTVSERALQPADTLLEGPMQALHNHFALLEIAETVTHYESFSQSKEGVRVIRQCRGWA